LSASRYIDKYDIEQARKRLEKLFESKQILRLFYDLRDVCEDYYENELKPREIKACNPCGCKDTISMKDTFHQNFTELNGECLNSYIDSNDYDAKALEGINYAFQFMKERSNLNENTK
jgi:hypothetical protein